MTNMNYCPLLVWRVAAPQKYSTSFSSDFIVLYSTPLRQSDVIVIIASLIYHVIHQIVVVYLTFAPWYLHSSAERD